jgi:hypothetical protein
MTDKQEDTAAPGTDELRAQVERTRERLGGTVEALAAKTDVKARTKEKAAILGDAAASKTADLVHGTVSLVQDKTPEPVRAKAAQATGLARRNRTPVLAACAGAALVAAAAVRRSRRKGR